MQSAILKSQYGQQPLDGSFVSITNDNLCTENAIQCFSDCLLHSNGSDNIPSRFSTAIEILPSHVFTEHVFDAPFIVHVAPDLDKSIFSKLLTRAMQHHPKSLGTLLNIHFIEDDKTFYIIDFVINIFGISFLVHWMKENCITLDHDLTDFLKICKHAGANSPQIQNMISLHSDRADEILADYHSADFDKILPIRITSAINMIPAHIFTGMFSFIGSSDYYPFMVYACLQFNKKVFFRVLSQAIRHHRHSAGTLLIRWSIDCSNEYSYIMDPVVHKFGYSAIYNFLKEKNGIRLMSNNYETFRENLTKSTRYTRNYTTD